MLRSIAGNKSLRYAIHSTGSGQRIKQTRHVSILAMSPRARNNQNQKDLGPLSIKSSPTSKLVSAKSEQKVSRTVNGDLN
jgi:hypothetical protein